MERVKNDITLTANQQEAITYQGENILVSACAGSGKTFVLVQRVLNMITRKDNPVSIDEICVVTFTNAAAKEMKNKIKKTILQRISELDAKSSLDDDERNEYDKLKTAAFKVDFSHISTLHGFCKNLIEDNYKELNLNPNFSEITGYDREKLIEEVLTSVFEEEYGNEDFRKFVSSYCNKYNDAIVKNIIKSYHEFLTTIPDKKEWFDSFCNSIDDKKYKDALDGIIGIVTKPKNDENMPYKFNTSKSKENFKLYGKDVKIRYDKRTLDKVYELFKNHIDILNRIVIEFDYAYSKEKRRKNVLDFADLEKYALELLYVKKDGYITKEISKLGLEIAGSFKQIFVDEYQDINSVQEEIIRAISNNYQNKNLFLVGDVKQSIYLFRHARCEIFMDKYNKYSKGSGGHLIKMNDNFRCTKAVIDSVNKLFTDIMKEDYGDVEYNKDHELICTRENKEKNIDIRTEFLNICYDSEKVKEYEAENKNTKNLKLNYNEPYYWKSYRGIKTNIYAEGLMIGKRIIELIDESKASDDNAKVKFSDIALLVQTRSDGLEYKKALDELHIPSQIGDSSDDFFLSIEIRLTGDILKVINNPREDISLMAVLRSELIGLSDEEILKISTFANKNFYDKKNNGGQKLIQSKEKGTDTSVRSLTESVDFINFVNSEENINLYDKLVYFIQNNGQGIEEQEMVKKINLFFEIFEDLRDKSKYLSIDELIKEIYKRTSLNVIVSGWEDGARAVNNLESLISYAQVLRSSSHNSLFDFIRVFEDVYTNENKINKGRNDTDNKVANFDVINPNCVKIITIHYSKGLEYPIVFVTNVNKFFNEDGFKNSKENNFAFDTDNGISFNPIDDKKNQYPILKKLYATCEAKRKYRAEKLRLFYVALTRARDKLILTSSRGVPVGELKSKSTSKKKDKTSDKDLLKNEIASPNFVKDEVKNIVDATSFISYLEYVYNNKMQDESSRNDGSLLSNIYSIYDRYEDIVSLCEWVKNHKDDLLKVDDNAIPSYEDNTFLNETKSNIEKVYTYSDATTTKPKISVSDIAKKHFVSFSEIDVQNVEDDKKNSSDNIGVGVEEKVTNESSTVATTDAILKGNSYHRFMQIFDFNSLDIGKLNNELLTDEIKKQKKILTESKLLGEIEAGLIENEKISAFINSELGKKFIMASHSGKLFREQPFMKLLSKKEIFEFSAENSEIVALSNDEGQIVQGVIDAFFIEDGAFTVIDYKTDAVAKYGDEKGSFELIERYKNQLKLYARALSEILNLSCKGMFIYSFDLSKVIEIE